MLSANGPQCPSPPAIPHLARTAASGNQRPDSAIPRQPPPPAQPWPTGRTRPELLAAQAQVGDGAHAQFLNLHSLLLSDTRTRTDQSWHVPTACTHGVVNGVVLKGLRPKCRGPSHAPPNFLLSRLSPAVGLRSKHVIPTSGDAKRLRGLSSIPAGSSEKD